LGSGEPRQHIQILPSERLEFAGKQPQDTKSIHRQGWLALNPWGFCLSFHSWLYPNALSQSLPTIQSP